MNKNTLIGSLVIAGLLIWSIQLSSQNAEAKKAAAGQKQSTEVQSKESSASSRLTLAVSDSLEAAPVLLGKKPAELKPLETVKPLEEPTDESVATDTAGTKTLSHQKFVVENENFTVVMDNRGAKISSIIIHTLKDSSGNFPEIIADTALGVLNLKLDNVDLDEQLFEVVGGAPAKINVTQDTSVTFIFRDVNNNKVIRKYSFSPKGVSIGHKILFEGFQPNDYEISLKGGMKETEQFPKGKSFLGASYFFSEVIFNNTYSVEREVITEKKRFNKDEGKISWAGLRRKYVALTIQYPEPVEATINAAPFKTRDFDPADPGTYQIALTDYLRNADRIDFDLMILPLEWSELKTLGSGYEKVIVSGWQWIGADVWFVALCGFLLSLLKTFYAFIPNYGIAIILLTILVKLVTTPLTLKQLRSTKAMQQFKPELDAINIKYRSDPQKKQAAILEFYKKHQINPMASCTGGCLPMLIQFPIFIGLFMVFGRAVELRGQPFFGWIQDLSRSDVIWDGFSIPFIMPAGIVILPIVMFFTTYFQMKQSMTAITDPVQKKMMTWMMPIMMFVFSAVMPSGLVLYWIISNLWGIAQYAIINRKTPATAAASVSSGAQVIDAKVVHHKKHKKKKQK